MLLYAVGDIHGQKPMLDEALSRIARDGGDDARIVFVGDYADRGADVRGVIDTFLEGVDQGRDWRFLKGNHDRMFQRFLENGETKDANILSGKGWFHPALGGEATLRSYMDVDAVLDRLGARPLDSYGMTPMAEPLREAFRQAAVQAVPDSHIAFLQTLPLMHHLEDKIFVHAGIRPGLPLGYQQEEDLMWIRDPFLEDTRSHGGLVVHGHTAGTYPDLRINRLNIDTGAGYGRELFPVVFDDGEIHALTDTGREQL